MAPSILVVAGAVVVKGVLHQSLEIALLCKIFVELFMKDAKQFPFGLFLSEGLLSALLFHGTLRQPLAFLVGHLDLLDLRPTFLDLDPLVLDRRTFVFHLRNGEAEIKVDVELLLDVVETQLNHRLPEGGLLLGILDGVSSEDEVVHLNWVAILVGVFAHVAQTERDAETNIGGAKLCGLLWSDALLLKAFDDLVVGHVHKDFGATLQILGLDDEARLWLDRGAAFLVDDRVAIGVGVLLNICLGLSQLIRHFALFNLLIHR